MAYCPSSVRVASHRSPFHLRTSIIRSRLSHPSPVRTLWWWTRSTQSNLDDAEEERFLRTQRLLRHRYAKIARRRAMWDREPASRAWFMHTPYKSFDDHPQGNPKAPKFESSKSSKQEQAERPKQEDPAISFHKDFNTFRQAVDRAMERDPYGTLFGRRLWSPLSANNMSWTSFSWFADPKDLKENKVAEEHTSQTTQCTSSNVSEPISTRTENYTSSIYASQTFPNMSENVTYVYDPVSGRKIPERADPSPDRRQSKATSTSAKAESQNTEEHPRRSIFDTLFGENAVDVPVKTYEPPKVYGYGGIQQTKDSSASTKMTKTKPGFENSRKREFQALKAATLGNTIDTTAEFGGKYSDPKEPTPIKPSSDPEADAPLFSGTTYEGKAAKILKDESNKSNWLQKEGFSEASVPLNQGTGSAKSDARSDRIQPALDRFKPSALDTSALLQPSLDRSNRLKRTKPSGTDFKSTGAWQAKVDAAEKAEDIDLLRSSDLRAGIKLNRQTKQQMMEQKQHVRENLEKAFAAKQSEADEIARPVTSSGFERLRKHLTSNPEGIVARTLQSVGSLNESFQKLMPNISDPVEDAGVKANSENPPAEVRTIKTAETTAPAAATDVSRPHPLSEATVKEGIPRYPIIEDHIYRFEPRYADLVSEMKSIRRQLHESKIQLRHLRLTFHRRPWVELESERLDEYAKSPLIEEDLSASGFDEPLFTDAKKTMPMTTAPATTSSLHASTIFRKDHGPRSFDEPVASYTQKAEVKAESSIENKAKMEPPVFTPAGSSVWNDEQPPPIAELRSAVKKDFTSPYVMLIGSSSNGVRAVPAPNLPHLGGRSKANTFEILAGLPQDRASQFLAYFPRLQEAGYELVNGDANKLTFRKISTKPASSDAVASTCPDKKAATVLDEIPAEIDPPGPSAPIAPPSSRNRPFDGNPKPTSRVRRQEEVFSGASTAPTHRAEPSHNIPPSSSHTPYESPEESGFVAGAARTVRRIVLTVLAVAGGAYVIGFISEGVGAQTQVQKGLSGEVGGPRKRIVLPVEDGERWKRGTRPGIYSTESSR